LARSRSGSLRRRLHHPGTGKRLGPITRSTASTLGTASTSFANRWPTRPTARSAQGSSAGFRKCRRNGIVAGGVEPNRRHGWFPRRRRTAFARSLGVRRRYAAALAAGGIVHLAINSESIRWDIRFLPDKHVPGGGIAAEKPPICIRAAVQLSSFQRQSPVLDLC
jgi:hypothetical protein